MVVGGVLLLVCKSLVGCVIVIHWIMQLWLTLGVGVVVKGYVVGHLCSHTRGEGSNLFLDVIKKGVG